MSSKMTEFAYFLLSGTTVVVILLATIWWSRRNRNTGDEGESLSGGSSTSSNEDIRVARLRKFEEMRKRPATDQQEDAKDSESNSDGKKTEEAKMNPLQDISLQDKTGGSFTTPRVVV